MNKKSIIIVMFAILFSIANSYANIKCMDPKSFPAACAAKIQELCDMKFACVKKSATLSPACKPADNKIESIFAVMGCEKCKSADERLSDLFSNPCVPPSAVGQPAVVPAKPAVCDNSTDFALMLAYYDVGCGKTECPCSYTPCKGYEQTTYPGWSKKKTINGTGGVEWIYCTTRSCPKVQNRDLTCYDTKTK